jgi:hypothetical protein
MIEEELRLDANAEDFSSSVRVLVGTRGEIVVPLSQDGQLRIYDSTGRRIAAVGRRGQAPGEFQSLGRVGLKADTFWVHDARARRFTYVAPTGEILRTGSLPGSLAGITPFSPVQGFGLITAVGINADGSMLAMGRRMEGEVGRFNIDPNDEVLNISVSGEIRGVAQAPSLQDERWNMEVAGLGRSVPFAARPHAAFSSDGSRFAFLTTDLTSDEGGTWTITVYRANGDTAFTRTFPFHGVPIPGDARDSAAAAEIRPPGSPTEGPPDLDIRFQKLALERMPPVYPPLQALLLGMDETAWITLRDTAGVRTTHVLDARGELVGTVALSTRSTIRQAMSTRIWVTEVDDVDLASVVRYRVRGISCGPPSCR